MSSDQPTSYREVFGEILADHHECPRNWGKQDSSAQHEHGYNPLCGDQVDLYLSILPDQKVKLTYEGEGCSICMASASILSERVNSLSLSEVPAWIESFRQKMQGGPHPALLPADDSGDDLTALYGIARFPVRIKCALLPWTTLNLILKKTLDQKLLDQKPSEKK